MDRLTDGWTDRMDQNNVWSDIDKGNWVSYIRKKIVPNLSSPCSRCSLAKSCQVILMRKSDGKVLFLLLARGSPFFLFLLMVLLLLLLSAAIAMWPSGEAFIFALWKKIYCTLYSVTNLKINLSESSERIPVLLLWLVLLHCSWE